MPPIEYCRVVVISPRPISFYVRYHTVNGHFIISCAAKSERPSAGPVDSANALAAASVKRTRDDALSRTVSIGNPSQSTDKCELSARSTHFSVKSKGEICGIKLLFTNERGVRKRPQLQLSGVFGNSGSKVLVTPGHRKLPSCIG